MDSEYSCHYGVMHSTYIQVSTYEYKEVIRA